MPRPQSSLVWRKITSYRELALTKEQGFWRPFPRKEQYCSGVISKDGWFQRAVKFFLPQVQDRAQSKIDCHVLSVIRVREKVKGFFKTWRRDLKTKSVEIRILFHSDVCFYLYTLLINTNHMVISDMKVAQFLLVESTSKCANMKISTSWLLIHSANISDFVFIFILLSMWATSI